MLIHVTQKHIEAGRLSQDFPLWQCPINRAIFDAIGLMPSTGYGWTNIPIPYLIEDSHLNTTEHISLRLPAEASTFIRDFDCGAPVDPFSFELHFDNIF